MGRLTLLGVQVDPLTIFDLNEQIAKAIAREEHWIIANHNLHSVYLYHRDPKMRAFYDKAKVIHIDGMPLAYWGRLLGYPLKQTHRVTYVDWVYPLMAEARHNGWRVFYLGGKPGVADRAASNLCNKLPGLQIRTRHGYFSRKENSQILEEIAHYQTHILMVGMGMPTQEHWIIDNFNHIAANTILTAGACFDYIAGAIPPPPRWMGKNGLEWLYRLICEPRRLWRRYLIEPWFLLPYLAADFTRRRRK